MKLKIAVAAAGLAGVFAGGAHAEGMEDVSFVARVGPVIGLYQNDSAINISVEQSSNPDQVPNGTFLGSFPSDDSWESAVGLQAGISAGMGNFYGDFAIEYLKVDSDAVDNRTDILLTAGYLFGDHWQGFAGYRMGMQGDSAFNDDLWDESGFFVGAGVGGLEVGALTLGLSGAYNFSKVDTGGGDLDYDGISVKLSGSLTSFPQHSLQLRFQTFDLEDVTAITSDVDGDGVADDGTEDGQPDLFRVNAELSESYLMLSYIYTFAF